MASRLSRVAPRQAACIIQVEDKNPAETAVDSDGVGLRNRSGLQIRRQPRAPSPRGAMRLLTETGQRLGHMLRFHLLA